MDHEEEYIDEDRYTTVTVEEVDVTKEGLSKTLDSEDEDEDAKVRERGKEVEGKEKAKKIWPKKVKKRAFRYETKAERKLGRAKEKAKATARRGED